MNRRQAREVAVQTLYRISLNEDDQDYHVIHSVIEQVSSEEDSGLKTPSADDRNVIFAAKLVKDTLAYMDQIDELLKTYLSGWKLDRLSKVDLQILRLAVYEMMLSEDVPPKAVVNEAIELAKHFGTEESGKFVNGVLGKILKEKDTITLQQI